MDYHDAAILPISSRKVQRDYYKPMETVMQRAIYCYAEILEVKTPKVQRLVRDGSRGGLRGILTYESG